MKKYILKVTIIIVVLVLAGLGFAYLATKEKEGIYEKSEETGSAQEESIETEKTSEKTTKEIIAGLLDKKFNQPANRLIIEFVIDTGAFAKGTYNEPGAGGGIWLAAKTAKGWELASAGNGIVPCEDIGKYNFPKNMVPACIDTQNNNNLIQR
jgi:hypothetical protein